MIPLLLLQFACVVGTVLGLRGSRSPWVPLAFFLAWFPVIGWAVAAYACLRTRRAATAPVQTIAPTMDSHESNARVILARAGIRAVYTRKETHES